MTAELRTGRWEDVLSDVSDVSAIITDTPYSARTHDGHDAGTNMANRAGEKWERSDGAQDIVRPRRELFYDAWDIFTVNTFVKTWAPRNRGWFVAFSDSDLCPIWRAAFEANGLTGFQPIPVLIPGMTVRMSGDGPSSWAVYLNVARPKALHKWGTLPGGYHKERWYLSGQGEREHIGGKPESLMRAIIRDYTKPDDLVCDPCAGAGTTLVAAVIEGRRAIGAEVNPETATAAIARLSRSYTPDLFSAGVK